jgi:hypothetical protein
MTATFNPKALGKPLRSYRQVGAALGFSEATAFRIERDALAKVCQVMRDFAAVHAAHMTDGKSARGLAQ